MNMLNETEFAVLCMLWIRFSRSQQLSLYIDIARAILYFDFLVIQQNTDSREECEMLHFLLVLNEAEYN